MPAPRLIISLLVLPAIAAGGCGESTQTTSTTASTSASTGTSAATGATAQTASQSTGSKEAQPTTTTSQPTATNPEPHKKTTEVDHHGEQKASKESAAAAKPSGKTALERISPKKRFPEDIELKFFATCEQAKGSHSSCECFLAKQEVRKVQPPPERARLIAEVFALEFAVRGSTMQEVTAGHTQLSAGHALKLKLPKAIQQELERCIK